DLYLSEFDKTSRVSVVVKPMKSVNGSTDIRIIVGFIATPNSADTVNGLFTSDKAFWTVNVTSGSVALNASGSECHQTDELIQFDSSGTPMPSPTACPVVTRYGVSHPIPVVQVGAVLDHEVVHDLAVNDALGGGAADDPWDHRVVLWADTSAGGMIVRATPRVFDMTGTVYDGDATLFNANVDGHAFPLKSALVKLEQGDGGWDSHGAANGRVAVW